MDKEEISTEIAGRTVKPKPTKDCISKFLDQEITLDVACLIEELA